MTATSEANVRRIVLTMQESKETEQGGAEIIKFTPRTTLAGRLIRELGDLSTEMASGAGAYLKIAFFPDRIKDWLPLSLARKSSYGLRKLVTHPMATLRDGFAPDTAPAGYIYEPVAHSIEFMADMPSPDEKKRSRHGYFKKVLAVSGVIHMTALVYLGVMAMFGQFLGLKVVNKPYRKLEPRVVVDKLYYSPELSSNAGETTPLEQLLEEERRRRERERIAREKAEREKAEKEEQAKEDEASSAEEQQEQPADTTSFGEINEAPIKDLIGKVYKLYQEGKLNIDSSFSVMESFKVNCDGTISKIKIEQSSGNDVIDETARQVLHLIGESRAIGSLCQLTSNTISLDLNDKYVRLRITSFASTPDIASRKARDLNNIAFLAKLTQKGDTAELLSQLKVTSNNKRIDADLTLTRARATEMMQASFGANTPR